VDRQQAISKLTDTDGVDLDKELHDDFSQVVKDHTKDVLSSHEKGTF